MSTYFLQLKHGRERVADLLRSNKEEKARIEAEYVIRLERTLQAYDGRVLACNTMLALRAISPHGARAMNEAQSLFMRCEAYIVTPLPV